MHNYLKSSSSAIAKTRCHETPGFSLQRSLQCVWGNRLDWIYLIHSHLIPVFTIATASCGFCSHGPHESQHNLFGGQKGPYPPMFTSRKGERIYRPQFFRFCFKVKLFAGLLHVQTPSSPFHAAVVV